MGKPEETKNSAATGLKEEPTIGNLENLGDKELSAVTGGYVPIFDECLQRYDWEKCYHGATIFNAYMGCPNCKLVDIKKGKDYNTSILSCTKGYFSNVEGPHTWVEEIR